MAKTFKHRGGTYWINYHVVFCPKRRQKVLNGNIALDCEIIIKEAVEKVNGKVESLTILPDHVHLFISATPKFSPNQLVKRIKSATSLFLRKKYPQLRKLSSLWSSSYYIGTTGTVSESVVKLYIENQKNV